MAPTKRRVRSTQTRSSRRPARGRVAAARRVGQMEVARGLAAIPRGGPGRIRDRRGARRILGMRAR